MTENDDEDKLQSLKRSEIKFHQMKQLLNQELEKSQLLERQLTENHKKSPKISWGLGYQGLTSQEYDEAGGIRFIKAEVKLDDKLKAAAQQVDKAKAEEKSGLVTKTKENQNTACGNGGLFSGKRGHHGTSSQTFDNNYGIKFAKCSIPVISIEQKDVIQANTVTPKIQDIKIGQISLLILLRAWRLNLCFLEPKKCGHVWISKRDLYPKFTKGVSHEHTNVLHSNGRSIY
ncbi:hypothetical protein Bca52824_033719 [Brassica carinata]|uniref:Uncharacterized protein n=1 Tax=Brassica carinata TaxID=52824 RepID=A0A8X7SF23_BRACI|nr:hypothetical protein Bca52824_033719 [Brassica carinata]